MVILPQLSRIITGFMPQSKSGYCAFKLTPVKSLGGLSFRGKRVKLIDNLAWMSGGGPIKFDSRR